MQSLPGNPVPEKNVQVFLSSTQSCGTLLLSAKGGYIEKHLREMVADFLICYGSPKGTKL